MGYFRNRWAEPETKVSLGALGFGVLALLVPPQYLMLVNIVAGILGFGVAAAPTSKPLV